MLDANTAKRINTILPRLDERLKRQYLAAEAEALGRGGIKKVSQLTAVPYGVYDILFNEGYVNVGISKDTAQFAVQSIRTWWHEMGKDRFSGATKLFIAADRAEVTGAVAGYGKQNCKDL